MGPPFLRPTMPSRRSLSAACYTGQVQNSGKLEPGLVAYWCVLSLHSNDPLLKSTCPGQLPYLVHDQHVVTSFQSIVKYVSDLRGVDHAQYPDANLDILLSPSQKSQRTAWTAHAESHLGDLVVSICGL